MDKLNVIGKSFEKKDVMSKVLGTAQYAADLEFDNMLFGAVKRSEVPSAILKNIDTSKAKALLGVVAVLTYKDIPNDNRIGIILKDEPVLVDDEIRRIGDALAIVAAETKEIAEEAVKLIEVEYEELKPIFSIDEALDEGSHKIHGKSNILQTKDLIKGDVDAVIKECDIIIENTFKTNYIAHTFIEPEAGIAKYENDLITIWSSTQNPHFDRGEVARMLGFSQSRVRSIQTVTGGGFGGKLDISIQCHAALLAYYTKRPVKFVRNRVESMAVSSKRHPITMDIKIGAKKDGTILFMDASLKSDTGSYASYGPAVIARAMTHITGPYNIPNVRVKGTFVYTNNPMAGAMRGFGVPQAAVAHEGIIEELAEKLGISSVDIRLKNALKVGDYTATNQKLLDSVGIVETIEKAVEKAKEVIIERKSTKKRGTGIGCMWYGIGNTGLPNPAAAFVEVHGDGSATALVGCADIGQGSTTVMAQIVAETLGVCFEDINIISADTGVTPEGGATSASRQTYISGNACVNASNMAKKILLDVAAEVFEVDAEDIDIKNRIVFVKNDDTKKIDFLTLMGELKKRGKIALGSGSFNPDTTSLDPINMQGIPYGCYAFATHIVEVEVDTDTGEVELLKVVAAHDVGQAINRKMVEAQIEGGCAMGTGFALLEEIEVEKGAIMNPEFSKYLILTDLDMPEIYPIIVEDPTSTGPYGAKGVGEPALIPTAPAILNAIYNAIGVRFTEVPVTPRKIIEALSKKIKN